MPRRSSRLTVLLVHAYPLVRAGMRSMLAAPDIRVTGEAATAADALRLVRKRAPDLVMMGCYPATADECSELLEKVKAQSPSTSVILITGSERTFDLSRAIRLGCSGYLNPRVTRKDLLKALRAIARGECIIDPELVLDVRLEQLDARAEVQLRRKNRRLTTRAARRFACSRRRRRALDPVNA